MNFLAKIFGKKNKKKIPGGGIGHMDVLDSRGRLVGKIFYHRPNSDQLLDYTHRYAEATKINEEKLKNISSLPSNRDKIKAMYDVLQEDFFIPCARQIFVSQEGFDCGAEDFEWLKEYHAFMLSDLVTKAYQSDYQLKKN